jgi:transglutaminase-like putative cysteine protease
MPEFMALISITTYYKYYKKTKTLGILYNIDNPVKAQGDSIKGKLSKKAYTVYAYRVYKYIKKYKVAPNFVSTKIGRISYQTFIFEWSKILSKSSKSLPSKLTISVSKGSSINKYLPTYSDDPKKILPANIDPDDPLYQYLIATKNCQVNDPELVKLANSLTAGKSSQWDKAEAIFEWLNNNIGYSFYYNTKYGAKKTLQKGTGNCVDTSHLLIALFRASGLASRYVHGECTFTSSGKTYGHVWVEVVIDGKWIVADATSLRNSLGVIKNWNTKKYKLHGKYAEILF